MRRTPTIPTPASAEDLLDSALIARISRLDLASNRIFAGKLKGERRSKKRGESVEFADHRPYVRGDDLRHIDWNIYARLDTLFLKLFMEEEDLSLHIVIDATESSACGEPPWLVRRPSPRSLLRRKHRRRHARQVRRSRCQRRHSSGSNATVIWMGSSEAPKRRGSPRASTIRTSCRPSMSAGQGSAITSPWSSSRARPSKS